MKNLIKKLIPSFLLYLRSAVPNFYYDLKRYYKYSASYNTNSKTKLIGRIVMAYHIIEKGLTMPEPRLGFGKGKLIELIKHCNNCIDRFGYTDEQVKHGIEVIYEYKQFHDNQNFELDKDLLQLIETLNSKTSDVSYCAQRTSTKEEYFSKTENSFPEFSWSRSSVRSYSEEDISTESIIKSIDIARNTPSACNRQTSRTYIFSDKKQIESILAVQGGNRGFGHLTNKLVVVTAELGVFAEISERYQAYIDGGMFAMNLLYGLHYNKIAACILNCSNTSKKDKKMRSVCPIKDSEVFIAMITCGSAQEDFKIALSTRKSIENILTIS